MEIKMPALDVEHSAQVIDLISRDCFEALHHHLKMNKLSGHTKLMLTDGPDIAVYSYIAKLNKMPKLYKSLLAQSTPLAKVRKIFYGFLPSIISKGVLNTYLDTIKHVSISDQHAQGLALSALQEYRQVTGDNEIIYSVESSKVKAIASALNIRFISPPPLVLLAIKYGFIINMSISLNDICTISNGTSLLFMIAKLDRPIFGITMSDIIRTVSSGSEHDKFIFKRSLNHAHTGNVSAVLFLAASQYGSHIKDILDIDRALIDSNTLESLPNRNTGQSNHCTQASFSN